MQLMLKLKNGNTEEVTMAEAKELYDDLHQIFGPKNLFPTDWPNIGERSPAWPRGPSISYVGVDMAVKNNGSSFTIDK